MGYWDETDIPFYYGLGAARSRCATATSARSSRRPIRTGASSSPVPRRASSRRTSPTSRSSRPRTGRSSTACTRTASRWRDYASDLPGVAVIAKTANTYGKNISPIAQFHTDAAAGTLPAVSFVDPSFATRPRRVGGEQRRHQLRRELRRQGRQLGVQQSQLEEHRPHLHLRRARRLLRPRSAAGRGQARQHSSRRRRNRASRARTTGTASACRR